MIAWVLGGLFAVSLGTAIVVCLWSAFVLVRDEIRYLRHRRQRRYGQPSGHERSDRDDATEQDLLNGLDALAATPPRDFEPPVVEAPTQLPFVARSPRRITPLAPAEDGPGGKHRADANTARINRARVEQTQIHDFTDQFAGLVDHNYGQRPAGRGPDETSLTRYELTDSGEWKQTELTLDVAP